jgi:hypothetical protein
MKSKCLVYYFVTALFKIKVSAFHSSLFSNKLSLRVASCTTHLVILQIATASVALLQFLTKKTNNVTCAVWECMHTLTNWQLCNIRHHLLLQQHIQIVGFLLLYFGIALRAEQTLLAFALFLHYACFLATCLLVFLTVEMHSFYNWIVRWFVSLVFTLTVTGFSFFSFSCRQMHAKLQRLWRSNFKVYLADDWFANLARVAANLSVCQSVHACMLKLHLSR